MNKPLLAAGALLLGGIVTGGAIFVASSGGEEEAVQIQESASPSASVTPGSLAPSPTRTPSTSSPSSTPASSSAPTPSPPTIPDGWVLHSQQPSERSPAFSFAYPSNWFPYSTSNDVPGDGLSVSVYSFNRVEWGQPSNYPPESMKVDINVANAQRVGACGPSGENLQAWAVFQPDRLSPTTIRLTRAAWFGRLPFREYTVPIATLCSAHSHRLRRTSRRFTRLSIASEWLINAATHSIGAITGRRRAGVCFRAFQERR